MSVERAHAWLRKAENDLLAADNNLEAQRIPLDVVCFHCQQAAEKLLKGLLVFLGVPAPRSHDLLSLLEIVKGSVSTSIPEDVTGACLILNPYAIEIRYPDDAVTPTLEDAREARNSAQAVLDWTMKSLANRT